MNITVSRIYLLLLALAVLLAGCGVQAGSPQALSTPAPQPGPTAAPEPTSSPVAEPGRPFRLGIGQATSVGTLALQLISVTNDSRCPAQVTCAWEGAADIAIEASIDGENPSSHILKIYGRDRETDEAHALVGEYLIRLIKLEPYPNEPSPLASDQYTATFIVEPAAVAYTPVSDGIFDGVIIPETDARGFDPRADGYWTPAKEDIFALEAGLADFLRQAAPERSPELWQKQTTYKRQYGGIIRDGHRLVYTSFFCDAEGTEWRTRVMFVLDGGDCYFQLTYDVDQKQYGDLIVNGDA